MTPNDRCRVAPFGNLRIKACVPLPEAYRSLLRPSSPDEAKASINCCNWFYANAQYSRRLFYPLTYQTFKERNCFPLLFLTTSTWTNRPIYPRYMVGPDGLEPSTPRLSSACSNQLSYEPVVGKCVSRRRLVEPVGFEPATPCLQSRCSAN